MQSVVDSALHNSKADDVYAGKGLEMRVNWPPLQSLFNVIEYLVDSRVGIIHHVEEVPREAGAPPFFYFFAKACDTSAFCRQQNFSDTGGASVDRASAMAKAVGEAVERYCSAIFEIEDCPLSSFDSAPFPCVSPSEFALYKPEQYAQPEFPFVPFKTDTKVRWAPAKELVRAETRYVPAAMVYLPYSYDVEQGECPISQPISTGLACHTGITEATISAICEVIERDAFTIMWQAEIGMPQVRVETLSPLNRNLVDRIQRPGSLVTLLDITMDVGVPTILSVLRNTSSEAPALVFAASSNLDPEQATRKSLEELTYTGLLSQHLKTHMPAIARVPDYSNVVDQDSHVRCYGEHDNAHLAEFVFASSKQVDFGDIPNLATHDPKEDLDVLIEKVHAVNHRVLVADLTTPDVGELGLSVVRAIIPGFHPLCMGHRLRALGGCRLWSVPQRLGYAERTPESGDNPAPHPYP
jgi:ribosomal protein S12 methylthiotransferase accessory factor